MLAYDTSMMKKKKKDKDSGLNVLPSPKKKNDRRFVINSK
jgi:hypothetical protein